MKIEYNLSDSRVSWDQYKRFYIEERPFVTFDTNEAICTLDRHARPRFRRNYKHLNIGIWAENDGRHVAGLKDPEGTVVPQTWLLHAPRRNLLLMDYDTGRVVAITTTWWAGDMANTAEHLWRTNVPKSLRRSCSVYFPGDGDPPVGAPVTLAKPHVWLDGEKEHMDTLKAACDAWFAIERPTKIWVARGARAYNTALRSRSFNDLVDTERYVIAQNGIAVHRDVFDVPYLLTERRVRDS